MPCSRGLQRLLGFGRVLEGLQRRPVTMGHSFFYAKMLRNFYAAVFTVHGTAYDSSRVAGSFAAWIKICKAGTLECFPVAQNPYGCGSSCFACNQKAFIANVTFHGVTVDVFKAHGKPLRNLLWKPLVKAAWNYARGVACFRKKGTFLSVYKVADFLRRSFLSASVDKGFMFKM